MNTKLRTIITAGLTAGFLDITAAIVIYSIVLDVIAPKKLLQMIAGGIHGRATYDGGWQTALTGLALHFIIAMIFAVVFVFLYPVLRRLISSPVLLGILYGCIVWVVMNCVVVPHSALAREVNWNWKFNNIPLSALILIVCVGIPISLITAKMYKDE